MRQNRLKPRFYIIGERKCGSSSLFRYICDHPNVLPGRRKEPDFFTRGQQHIETNIETYWANFPDLSARRTELVWPELDEQGLLFESNILFDVDPDVNYITGEASANTFQNVKPEVIRQWLPDVLFILILRDPVDRTFSHYRMLKRFEEEGRNIGFQLRPFEEQIRREISEYQAGRNTPLISTSIYADALVNWVREFESHRLTVLSDWDLHYRAKEIMQQVYEYLEIDPSFAESQDFDRYNVAPSAAMSAGFAKDLKDFFSGFDAELSSMLDGRRFYWMQR